MDFPEQKFSLFQIKYRKHKQGGRSPGAQVPTHMVEILSQPQYKALAITKRNPLLVLLRSSPSWYFRLILYLVAHIISLLTHWWCLQHHCSRYCIIILGLATPPGTALYSIFPAQSWLLVS